MKSVIVMMTLVLGLAAGGAYWFLRVREKITAPVLARTLPEAANRPLKVETPIEPFLGVVVPREAVDVISKIDGPIKEIFVNVGAQVKANDRLVEIDDRPLRRDLALAQAALAGARAAETKALIELRDARERSARRARVAEDVSAEELSSARYSAKLGGANLTAAQAKVAEARAHVAQLSESLKMTDIRAPFAGTVAARYKSPGSLVGPSVPILRVIQSQALCVRFAVPIQFARTVVVGMPVNLQIETLTEPLDGKVENVAPEVDAASQMLYVESSLSLASKWMTQLQSGLVVHVTPKTPLLADGPATR